MEENLRPLTARELEDTIAIQMAAMRARKESGAVKDNPFFAKALVERLLRSGLRAFHAAPKAGSMYFDPPGSKESSHK